MSVRRVNVLLAAFVTASLAGCAGNLKSNPKMFTWHKEAVSAADNRLHVTLVKPASPSPPQFLVVFGSGDGGLTGVSKAMLQRLADSGYYVAGFSSREALGQLRGVNGKVTYQEARATLAAVIAQAKRALGLPENAPTIVTGMSRGSNMVIAAAGDSALRQGIAGAVAVALTRELDYLVIPDEAKAPPGVQMDKEGRIQTYPAIERLGAIPLAIIQSTNDRYVPAAESRKLLGPDTPTRRLYTVEAKDHSFSGGKDALWRDLDDAMKWIASAERSRTPR